MQKEITFLNYYWKSVKWFFANMVFGLFPLIFIKGINIFTNGNIGNEEISHLQHDGLILFVCFAIMGTVVVDFIQSGIKYNGIKSFAVYTFPFILLLFISTIYLLVFLKLTDTSFFNIDSKTTITTFILTFIYSSVAKSDFYMKEDLKQKKQTHE